MKAWVWLVPALLLLGGMASGQEPGIESHNMYFYLYCLQGNTEWGAEELFARVSHGGQHKETNRHDEGSNAQCNTGPQIDSLTFNYHAGQAAQIDVYEEDSLFDDTIDVKHTIYGAGCFLTITFGSTGYTISGGPYVPYHSRLYSFGDGESGCNHAGGISFSFSVHNCDCVRA